MNTLMITAALMLSSMMHNESIHVKSDLTQRIEQSLSNHELNLPLEANQKGLVRASVQVDANGKLHILDANYSHKELKDLLVQELANIEVDADTANEVFFYEFHFEKH
jgi:biopolymer transport protein ExbD